jgi:transposase-like protein
MKNEELNLATIAAHFSDDEKAREFLEAQRWPEGPICPHCGELNNAYRLQPKESKKDKHVRPGVWKCAGCREQFTVTVGTIFADSHIPLSKWLLAVHLLCASKKGMSAHQLHRMLRVSYKSAWFMAHRIRYAMTQEPLSSKLTGVIEVDETYIGGKFKSRILEPLPGRKGKYLAGVTNKAAVVSVLQRDGRVQSKHIQKVTSENLKPVLREMIDERAHLMTDTSSVLRLNDVCEKHDRVNHVMKEYVRYEDGVCITTNAVEGYFANLKRGINGVYHFVGKQHLHRYLSEFDFRYNTRKLKDGQRTVIALKQTSGKRLMLRDSKQQQGLINS